MNFFDGLFKMPRWLDDDLMYLKMHEEVDRIYRHVVAALKRFIAVFAIYLLMFDMLS